MDVPTPIDSRLNVDGRLSESPLPTYDGVPVSSSLSRYFRRYDGWVEGEGEGRTPISIFPPDGGRGPKRMGEQERRGWVPAPYQVRGRLFAGNCSVLMRWMCLLHLTRGSTWTGDSASRPYLQTQRVAPVPTYDGVPVSSSLSRYFRRCDGWVEGVGEGRTPISIFPPDGGRGPKRMGEQERRGWVPAPYRGTGQAFRGNDGWGAAPGGFLRRGRGEEGGFQTRPYGGTEGRERRGRHPHPGAPLDSGSGAGMTDCELRHDQLTA